MLKHLVQTLYQQAIAFYFNICIAEKAKAFWRNVDVDNVFEMLLQYLVHLRELIKGNTASDKGKHKA